MVRMPACAIVYDDDEHTLESESGWVWSVDESFVLWSSDSTSLVGPVDEKRRWRLRSSRKTSADGSEAFCSLVKYEQSFVLMDCGSVCIQDIELDVHTDRVS
jgi:hypothetical protein